FRDDPKPQPVRNRRGTGHSAHNDTPNPKESAMLQTFFLPAADPGLVNLLTGFLPVVIGGIAILFGLLLFVSQRYKRCPSNRILVIYGSVGKGKSATTVHGGGKFVWPIIQDYDYLILEPIRIEIPLK